MLANRFNYNLENMPRKFKLEDLPKGDFHISQIADKFYPQAIRSDSEGRTFNMASSTVSRVLRRMSGILELKDGYFYNGN